MKYTQYVTKVCGYKDIPIISSLIVLIFPNIYDPQITSLFILL